MHILFDIGGTKTRIATYKQGDSFEMMVMLDTPADYQQGIELFIKTIRELVGNETITSITGGIAGVVDRAKGELVSSHNLPDWAGKPIQDDLATAFNTKAFVENDAAMVGLGEAHYGAGKGFSIVAYITVSTGVGGARIVGGVIDEHVTGFEPGQQIIDVDGTKLSSGAMTNLGDYISGKGIEARMGKKPAEITDDGFWQDIARALAFGLNNTIVHWSPNVLVLGGSMMKKVGIPFDLVQGFTKEIMTSYPTLPEFRRATLGDLGGLYGALALCTQKSVQ